MERWTTQRSGPDRIGHSEAHLDIDDSRSKLDVKRKAGSLAAAAVELNAGRR